MCVLLILKGAKLVGALASTDFLVSKSRTCYKFLTSRSPNLGKSQKVSFCPPTFQAGLAPLLILHTMQLWCVTNEVHLIVFAYSCIIYYFQYPTVKSKPYSYKCSSYTYVIHILKTCAKLHLKKDISNIIGFLLYITIVVHI